VDDPAGALVGIHPVADLQQREHENADVDHVPRLRTHLDAIAHAERLANNDEQPPRQVGDRVLQGDGQAGGENTQVGGQAYVRPKPYLGDDQEGDQAQDVANGLAEAVAPVRLGHPPQNGELQ